MSPDFKFDVFLSHSSKDKPAVRELAEKLKADGVRVWFDDWILEFGDLVSLKIEQGLEESRILLFVMSANAFESDWTALERHTALFRDPTNSKRRFIPLLLEDCHIKDTLKQFLYVDWRNKDEEQYKRLLSAVRPSPEPSKLEVIREKSDKKMEASRILAGHTALINTVAITTDGKLIVSGSDDNTIRIWETKTGKCLKVLEGHEDVLWETTTTADGKLIVSGSSDGTIRVWETETGKCLKIFKGHKYVSGGMAIMPDGKLIVFGSYDNKVRVLETESGECLKALEGHSGFVNKVAITFDGRLIVSGSDDKTIRVWETETGKCLKILEGHTDTVWGVAITPDKKLIVSGSLDETIRVWETDSGKCLKILEGHTGYVYGVTITENGKLIVSSSQDKTIRVWETESGKCLSILEGHEDEIVGLAIAPDGKRIVSGSADKTVRVWDLPAPAKTGKGSSAPLPQTELSAPTTYTNAKVLLVGDSGVGKSGLAYRLTTGKFVETISTDGVWATQMSLAHEANTSDTVREIWLWDFAGQADYRLIHQLFMDETALAVLVFNPQSDNPFEGLGQWDRDLQRAAGRPFNKLLVAGRCDRGDLTVSQKSLDEFISRRGFVGYLRTSALTGENCAALHDAIVKNIDWDGIPHRSSPQIFKRLKEEVIKLKDEGKVLLRASELKQQLEMRLPDETFTIDELRAVVGLLASSGVVWKLEFGDFVLLQPERINSYAAAVVRKVRAHVDEIGCISEEQVLAGELDYQDMKRLPRDEEEIVLRAMLQIFVRRGLCLREATDSGTVLIFPSYFKRERPELIEHPAAFITFHFSGALDEIYTTLVVRLNNTPAFTKDRLWRFAADFKTPAGKRVGLKMTKKAEGAAEIVIYLEPDISEETKVTFGRYVHDFLKAKDDETWRERHYVCPACGEPFENRRAVRIRLEKGLKDIQCPVCEERIPLRDSIEEMFASEKVKTAVRELDEKAKTAIDNESREMTLENHARAVAVEAGQIYNGEVDPGLGIDGEIEFKDDTGHPGGNRVYLKFGFEESGFEKRKIHGIEVFHIKEHQAEKWQSLKYPLMIVSRFMGGQIHWVDVIDYINRRGKEGEQAVFGSDPFTALSLVKLRDRLLNQASGSRV